MGMAGWVEMREKSERVCSGKGGQGCRQGGMHQRTFSLVSSIQGSGYGMVATCKKSLGRNMLLGGHDVRSIVEGECGVAAALNPADTSGGRRY